MEDNNPLKWGDPYSGTELIAKPEVGAVVIDPRDNSWALLRAIGPDGMCDLWYAHVCSPLLPGTSATREQAQVALGYVLPGGFLGDSRLLLGLGTVMQDFTIELVASLVADLDYPDFARFRGCTGDVAILRRAANTIETLQAWWAQRFAGEEVGDAS